MESSSKDISKRVRAIRRQGQIFDLFNRRKLECTLSQMDEVSRDTLMMIPLMLHYNAEGMPGYSNDPKLPTGVYEYEPDDNSRRVCEKFFNCKPWNNPVAKETAVESLALMGSMGSIAQTPGSDADFWMIIDKKKFSAHQLKILQNRCTEIETWAWEKKNFEVHLFITDINDAQRNNFGTSDEESCGTAQAKMLKEEFYRTVLVLSGKKPLWWLIPLGMKEREVKKFKEIAQIGLQDYDDYIDLGHIEAISRAEYSGAAIWQMSKFIHSPFKSLLKMSLLVKYLKKSPELLCDELKKRVLEDMPQGKYVDPYVLLFETISQYCEANRQWADLEILQRCFYLKAGLKLTQVGEKDAQQETWRMQSLEAFILKWGWSRKLLNDLDSIHKWKIDKVHEFGEKIKELLIEQYRVIRECLKDEDPKDSLIDQADMHIIGQKLGAALANKPGKIERRYTYFFAGKMIEGYITFSFDQRSGNFQVFRGRDEERSLLFENTNFAYLLAWLVYNQIVNKRTSYGLDASLQNLGLNIADVTSCLDKMSKTFVDADPFKIEHEAFTKEPEVELGFTAIDLQSAIDVNKADAPNQAFSDDYKGNQFNEEEKEASWKDCSILMSNSHGELFMKELSEKHTIFNLLQILSKARKDKSSFPVEFWSRKNSNSKQVSRRVTNIYEKLCETKGPFSILTHGRNRFELIKRDSANNIEVKHTPHKITETLLSETPEIEDMNVMVDPAHDVLILIQQLRKYVEDNRCHWGIMIEQNNPEEHHFVLVHSSKRMLFWKRFNIDSKKFYVPYLRLVAAHEVSLAGEGKIHCPVIIAKNDQFNEFQQAGYQLENYAAFFKKDPDTISLKSIQKGDKTVHELYYRQRPFAKSTEIKQLTGQALKYLVSNRIKSKVQDFVIGEADTQVFTGGRYVEMNPVTTLMIKKEIQDEFAKLLQNLKAKRA